MPTMGKVNINVFDIRYYIWINICLKRSGSRVVSKDNSSAVYMNPGTNDPCSVNYP